MKTENGHDVQKVSVCNGKSQTPMAPGLPPWWEGMIDFHSQLTCLTMNPWTYLSICLSLPPPPPPPPPCNPSIYIVAYTDWSQAHPPSGCLQWSPCPVHICMTSTILSSSPFFLPPPCLCLSLSTRFTMTAVLDITNDHCLQHKHVWRPQFPSISLPLYVSLCLPTNLTMVLVSVVTSETSLLHSWLSPMRMAPSTHMYGVHSSPLSLSLCMFLSASLPISPWFWSQWWPVRQACSIAGCLRWGWPPAHTCMASTVPLYLSPSVCFSLPPYQSHHGSGLSGDQWDKPAP